MSGHICGLLVGQFARRTIESEARFALRPLTRLLGGATVEAPRQCWIERADAHEPRRAVRFAQRTPRDPPIALAVTRCPELQGIERADAGQSGFGEPLALRATGDEAGSERNAGSPQRRHHRRHRVRDSGQLRRRSAGNGFGFRRDEAPQIGQCSAIRRLGAL